MAPNPQKTPAESGTVVVNSRRFGSFAVREDQIIHLVPGLLGFSRLHRYVLIEHQPGSPFLWLQSLDDPELAFVVLDPGHIVPEYRPEPWAEIMKELEAESAEDLKVLVIVTIPPGQPQEMTAYLMGPVVINVKNCRGRQVIVEDPRYSHKHRLLDR